MIRLLIVFVMAVPLLCAAQEVQGSASNKVELLAPIQEAAIYQLVVKTDSMFVIEDCEGRVGNTGEWVYQVNLVAPDKPVARSGTAKYPSIDGIVIWSDSINYPLGGHIQISGFAEEDLGVVELQLRATEWDPENPDPSMDDLVVTAPIDFAMGPQSGLLKLDGGRCAIVLHYTATWTKSYPPGVYDASGKKIFRLDRDLLFDDSGHEYYFDRKWDRISKDGGIVMNYHSNKRQWEWFEGVPMTTSPILADRVDKESVRRIYIDDGHALKTPEQSDYPILRFKNGKYLNEFGAPVYSLYGHLPEWAQIILLHRYYEQVYLSDNIVEIEARRAVAADLFANSNSLAVDVFNWGADYGPRRKKTIVYFTELDEEIFVLGEGQIRLIKNKWLVLNEKPLLGSGSNEKIPEASFYLSKRKARKRGVAGIESKSVVLEIKARPEHSAEFRSVIAQYVADDREETVVEENDSISVETAASACSMLPELKSGNSKTRTTLRFLNSRRHPVHVYWINLEGKEVLYETLATGGRRSQETPDAHFWLVRDENGSCLGVFKPTENGSEVVLL